MFDYIIMGEPINLYTNPISLTEKILSFGKKGGKVLLKLKNTSDIRVLYLIRMNSSLDEEMALHILVQDSLGDRLFITVLEN